MQRTLVGKEKRDMAVHSYILEISKYVTALFMALYTYECFAVFRFDTEEQRKWLYIRQNLLMFAFHFTCYLNIYIQMNQLEYLFFFAFQQIALFAVIILYSMLYPKSNKLIVNNMCMLLSIGFVILTRLFWEKSVKQFCIVVLSLIVAMAIPFLMGKLRVLLRQWKWIYAGIGIASLGTVLLLGAVTNGSKLSYSIWGITFQPSELIKIVYVFFLAAMLKEAEKFKNVFLSAVVAAIHVMILVCSRDLGSALIFFVTYALMLYAATKKPFYLAAAAVCIVIASVVSYRIFSHIQVRVQAWKDPWSVIDGSGYQIAQSLFAIGSGGMFGLGLYGGAPKDIPHVETDFVFSAITEELGILFGICLVMIYISCFLMFMNIAMRTKDDFYRLAAFGIGVTYGFQIFLTVGGGTKFIPLTGVTLPLISYGGSSVLATLMMFAVIEGIYCMRQVGGNRIVNRNQRTEKEAESKTESETDNRSE